MAALVGPPDVHIDARSKHVALRRLQTSREPHRSQACASLGAWIARRRRQLPRLQTSLCLPTPRASSLGGASNGTLCTSVRTSVLEQARAASAPIPYKFTPYTGDTVTSRADLESRFFITLMGIHALGAGVRLLHSRERNMTTAKTTVAVFNRDVTEAGTARAGAHSEAAPEQRHVAIYDYLSLMDAATRVAARTSGLSYVLYEKRVHAAYASILANAPDSMRTTVEEELIERGFEPDFVPDETAAGECSTTGIAVDCCPCGYHE